MRAEDFTGPGIRSRHRSRCDAARCWASGDSSGAGRTELMELIFGVSRRPPAATLHIDGRTYRPSSPREAVAAGLSLVTEDRAGSGLFPGPPRAREPVRGLERAARPRRPRRTAAGRGHRRIGSGIVTPSVEQEVRRLSGGNQQKVVIGRWLAVDAKVYLLRRTHQGRRRRRQTRHLRLHRRAAQAGAGRGHRLVGPARAALDQRPHRDHAAGPHRRYGAPPPRPPSRV